MEPLTINLREEHGAVVDRILDALAQSGHREINSKGAVFRALLDLGISELEHSGIEVDGVSIEISESGEILIDQESSRADPVEIPMEADPDE
jgi:hypothetical protein